MHDSPRNRKRGGLLLKLPGIVVITAIGRQRTAVTPATCEEAYLLRQQSPLRAGTRAADLLRKPPISLTGSIGGRGTIAIVGNGFSV